MKRVRIYKDQPCMKCGGSTHKMQDGGSFTPHIMINPETGETVDANSYNDHLAYTDQGYLHEEDLQSMKSGGDWIQGAIKNPGRCTPGSPNYDCPKGSPQWNLAQTLRGIAKKNKKQYGGDIALQNESTDSIIQNRNNMFKDHIANNAMTVIAQEEMLNFAQQPNPMMMQDGGATSHPGYIGNPQLSMYIEQQKQLQGLQQPVFNTLFDAMENTNFNKQLFAKTKFLNNDLGKAMKKEYKDLNKDYRKMERNPLKAYEQMVEQAGEQMAAYGGTYPMYPMGGVFPPMQMMQNGGAFDPNQFLLKTPGDFNNYFYRQGSDDPDNLNFQPIRRTTYDLSLPDYPVMGSDPSGGIGQSMLSSGFIPGGYNQFGEATSWVNPAFSTQVPELPEEPVVEQTNETETPEETKTPPKKKKEVTDAAEEVEAAESTITPKKEEEEEVTEGNVNPNAGNEGSEGSGEGTTTTQQTQQGGYMTPLGVVYPNVGWGRRGQLPFYYNPGNISKTEIETRRALLKGNRPKKITFTHSLPGQQQPVQAGPQAGGIEDISKMNPEQLKEYLSTFEQFKGMFGDKEPVVGDPNKQMEENKKNKEEVSAALEEGMKPSPDAVEVTGIDPNQSVFSENGAFNWSPSSQLEETAGVGTGSNTPAKTEVDNTANNAPATTSNEPAMIPDFTYDKAGNLIPTGKMKPNPNYQAPVASNVQTPGNVMPNVDGIEPTVNVMPVVPDNYDESAYGHQMLKRFGGDPYMPEFGEGGGFGKALGIGLLGAVAAPAVFGGIGALGAGMAAKRGMKKGQQVFGQGMEMGQQMNPMNMMQPMARFGMEMPQYFFGGANREARQNNRQFHRGMRQGNPFAAIQAYMQMGGQNMVQGWDQVREGVAGVGGPWVQSFHNIGKGLENMGVPRQFTDPAGAMMGQMGQAKYGMEYKEGGEYELSDAEIQAIIQAGGEVEFL